MHGYTRGTHWGAQSTRGLPVERWAVHGEAYSQGLLPAVNRGGDDGDQSRSAEERRWIRSHILCVSLRTRPDQDNDALMTLTLEHF